MPNNTFQQIISKKEESFKNDIDTKYFKPKLTWRPQVVLSDEANSKFVLISSQEQLDFGNQLSFENRLNYSRLNDYIPQTIKLLQLIKESDFEYGINSAVDDFLRDKLQQNAFVTKEWLNQIFIENIKNVNVITGILRTIAHFSYYEVYPQGMTMALAALSNSNSEVKECGIRSFENWGTSECLKILKTVDVSEPWLKKYVSQVVRDLEEDFE